MSTATYSFLPYARQGIANKLESTGGARGSFTVKLDVHGDNNGVDKKSPVDDKVIEIYGPGDVIGLDPRSIIKTDPHNWVTNFEANYLPHIDFYDEDFPWRYTPVPPNGQRLNPWITLVVLAENEFEEGQNLLDKPLPFFKLKDGTTKNFFPKKEQLWAWAHVHFNGDLTSSDDKIVVKDGGEMNAALDKLQQHLSKNPDFAYSRLVCPRKLKPNIAYHAFVIPSYESGRLAGMGAKAEDIAAAQLKIAWESAVLEFPYYYRWRFNTGSMGDFEYLVRLLKPKKADSRIGRRVMDMTKPEGNLTWKEDTDHPLGGILRLGGALQVPEEALTPEEIAKKEKFDKWAEKHLPVAHPFQVQLAGFLNLADDYSIKAAEEANLDAKNDSDLTIDPNEDNDPLITPPIYGRWHAMVERVYKDRASNFLDEKYSWISQLNLDPRFRVAAHFGTRVVQENQENYMEAAWEQIGDVIRANRQVRFGQFSMAASTALYTKHFKQADAVSSAKTMLLTAPILKRVMFEKSTVFHNLRQNKLPNTILSAPMRRVLRPRGRLMNLLKNNQETPTPLRLESLVSQINDGDLLPAPPKVFPTGLPSVDEVVSQMEPPGAPGFIKDLLRKYPWLRFLPLIVGLILALLFIILFPGVLGVVVAATVAGGSIYLWRLLNNWYQEIKKADSLNSDHQKPTTVDTFPKSSDFRLFEPQEGFAPTFGATTDNIHGNRFKDSLKDLFRLMQVVKSDIPKPLEPKSLPLKDLAVNILDQIRPEKTIPAWTWQQVFIPGWIKDQLTDKGFVEAMAYPKINKPMYVDLKRISDELFLPNVHLIEQNSITLLETNQAFIEAYMVGLNHEFARELLWREYPTDQRGSYFRQFWDVSTILKDPALANLPEDKQREPYYDITKIHEWERESKLKSHDNRQKKNQPPKEEIVLVIRGELLKKYPTAVVYAHKADWTINETTNQPDVTLSRSLFNQAEGEKDKPDPEIIKTPLYSAKCDPDIYFFGFDLTAVEAKGESEPATPTKKNAGWFFVIKERAGEPRFGFDLPSEDVGSKPIVTWNDVDWSQIVATDEGVIDVLSLAGGSLSLPDSPVFPNDTEGEGQEEQYNDDKKVLWNNNIDAANLAYILYQVPMMVCVHASEMLLKK